MGVFSMDELLTRKQVSQAHPKYISHESIKLCLFLWKKTRKKQLSITIKHKTKVKRSTKWVFLARKICLKNDIASDTWARFRKDS